MLPLDNEGQKYCRMLPLEHSAILLTCIKRLLVLKTNCWSFKEWLFYIGFTVFWTYLRVAFLHRFCCILDLFQVVSLLYLNRLEEMLHVCRDLLQQDPTLVDVWMIVANLYAANNEVKATQQVGNLNFPINMLS